MTCTSVLRPLSRHSGTRARICARCAPKPAHALRVSSTQRSTAWTVARPGGGGGALSGRSVRRPGGGASRAAAPARPFERLDHGGVVLVAEARGRRSRRAARGRPRRPGTARPAAPTASRQCCTSLSMCCGLEQQRVVVRAHRAGLEVEHDAAGRAGATAPRRARRGRRPSARPAISACAGGDRVGDRDGVVDELHALPVAERARRAGSACPSPRSAGIARATSAASPPTMIVSVPASAPGRGAGDRRVDERAGRARRARAPSARRRAGAIVDMSANERARRRPSSRRRRRPSSTASTSGPSTTIVITSSALAAASAGRRRDGGAGVLGRPRRRRSRAVRFQTVSSWPAREQVRGHPRAHDPEAQEGDAHRPILRGARPCPPPPGVSIRRRSPGRSARAHLRRRAPRR